MTKPAEEKVAWSADERYNCRTFHQDSCEDDCGCFCHKPAEEKGRVSNAHGDPTVPDRCSEFDSRGGRCLLDLGHAVDHYFPGDLDRLVAALRAALDTAEARVAELLKLIEDANLLFGRLDQDAFDEVTWAQVKRWKAAALAEGKKK